MGMYDSSQSILTELLNVTKGGLRAGRQMDAYERERAIVDRAVRARPGILKDVTLASGKGEPPMNTTPSPKFGIGDRVEANTGARFFIAEMMCKTGGSIGYSRPDPAAAKWYYKRADGLGGLDWAPWCEEQYLKRIPAANPKFKVGDMVTWAGPHAVWQITGGPSPSPDGKDWEYGIRSDTPAGARSASLFVYEDRLSPAPSPIPQTKPAPGWDYSLGDMVVCESKTRVKYVGRIKEIHVLAPDQTRIVISPTDKPSSTMEFPIERCKPFNPREYAQEALDAVAPGCLVTGILCPINP